MFLLEQGTIPWRKPWNAKTNMPKNLISKKEYRGIYIFLLATQQYNSPYWITFKQVQEKGGSVRKGEKSTPVIFWKWLVRNESAVSDEETETRNGKILLLRYYSVFNLEQTGGIKAPDPVEVVNDFSPIEKGEQIIANMPHKPDI